MRILVIEDDEVLGRALLQSLRNTGFSADLTGSVHSAQNAVACEHFDAIILDLGLPDRDGFDLLGYLRNHKIHTPVLILTARDAIEDRVRGLDLGADDYVIKPIAMTELHARLRALIRRSSGVASPRIKIGRLEIDTACKRAYVDETRIDLSGQEWKVLEYLVVHAKQILSKEQIIQGIADWDKDISPNAIEAYVSRVRGQIENSGATIRTIRGLGYMIEES